MKNSTRIILGFGAFAALAYWALTTKNEVVHSFVFPLKVKLGLAKYKTDEDVLSDTGDSQKSIWQKYGDRLPKIFKETIYRIPTTEELKEVASLPLTVFDLMQGFTYTMVGRGVHSPENERQIKESLSTLSKMYPDRPEYQEALKEASKPKTGAFPS